MSFTLTITTAGRDALVDAQNGVTAAIQVEEVGFSDEVFTVAPTLTALPGEVKRISSVSGAAISETVIHMTAQDSSQDAYDVRGFGLFLADGTLFAVYGQADPIVSKAPVLNLQLAFDIAFQDAISGDITFGDATFLFPPATETVKGVAEIATQAEVDAGEDDERIVTPLKLAERLAEAFGAIVSATETVQGVAEIATLAEALTGTDDQRMITPLKLAGVLEPVIAMIADEAADRAAAILAVEAQIDAEQAARQGADNSLAGNIAALAARTITGSGLATGGGSLAANRVIAVAAASAAQVRLGTASTAAITPSALGPFSKSLGTNGYCTVPTADPANTLLIQWGRFTAAANGSTSVSFPIAFTQAFAVVVDGTSDTNTNRQDNYPALRDGSVTQTGFQVFNANDISDGANFIAIGRIDLS